MREDSTTLLVAILGIIAPHFLNPWVALFVGILSILWLSFQLVRGVRRWKDDTQKRREEKEKRSEEKERHLVQMSVLKLQEEKEKSEKARIDLELERLKGNAK
ncbi:MAG: hypothetical protein GDA42_01995 [Ekhidna sp.]|nr:hypothetical protein [Ekhidna sp.]